MITGPLLICSCLTLSISVFTSGTGAPPTTVNRARGHSVSLHPGIPVGPDVADVVWRRVSPRNMIVKYSKGNVSYFGPDEYKRRITFHPGNFSLEIHDLRREDSGDYEVMFAAAVSGAESITTVRLEVYDSTTVPTSRVNPTDADPVSSRLTLVIGLSIVGALLVSTLIVILLVTWRRRAAGKETSSGTEDPAAENTVYANIRWNAKSRTGQQPPKGNERFVDPEVHPETPHTVYAAVTFRARPPPGSAGEEAARR
ncbi:CD48 antigen-like [Mobula birostris]|uniref:CD48 antigen-like n=1 Tax=Mobula birostris TaxID=1983395 RepID=UPI003B2871F7